MLVIGISSCDESGKQIENLKDVEIVEIGGCEYIKWKITFGGHYNLIHKGNCKFCSIRLIR